MGGHDLERTNSETKRDGQADNYRSSECISREIWRRVNEQQNTRYGHLNEINLSISLSASI